MKGLCHRRRDSFTEELMLISSQTFPPTARQQIRRWPRLLLQPSSDRHDGSLSSSRSKWMSSANSVQLLVVFRKLLFPSLRLLTGRRPLPLPASPKHSAAGLEVALLDHTVNVLQEHEARRLLLVFPLRCCWCSLQDHCDSVQKMQIVTPGV